MLIVDEQQAVRRGLQMRFAMEPDLEVVGQTGYADEALSLARALRPDVVLMDIEVPDRSGTQTVEALPNLASQSAVVIFTLDDNSAIRRQCMAAGAAAFVAKHQGEETLLAALRRVAAQLRGNNDGD